MQINELNFAGTFVEVESKEYKGGKVYSTLVLDQEVKRKMPNGDLVSALARYKFSCIGEAISQVKSLKQQDQVFVKGRVFMSEWIDKKSDERRTMLTLQAFQIARLYPDKMGIGTKEGVRDETSNLDDIPF